MESEEGEWKFYHENGKLESRIGNYKNGKQEGEWKFYHRKLEIIKMESQKENGNYIMLEGLKIIKMEKQEGELKFYHENGKLTK